MQGPMDFSTWPWQDEARDPLGEQPRWLSAQSLASIATGCEGKVAVSNASKRGVTFDMGFVEGFQRRTQVVPALAAPAKVVKLFAADVARRVLEEPSFRARLEAAGAEATALSLAIDAALQTLELLTPEEKQALRAFCAACGAGTDEKPPLRTARVHGQLVIAVVDVVMLAKKCSYEAARHICQRVLFDHWNVELGSFENFDGPDLNSRNFPVATGHLYSVRLQAGRRGGQATVCAAAACIAELLVLIPGCELSVQLRRDMVASFFGVDGHVSFDSLLANPRVKAFVHRTEHPVGQFLDLREQRSLVQGLPGQLQLALAEWGKGTLAKQHEEALAREERMLASFQVALAKRDEGTLAKQREELQVALAKQHEEFLAREERMLLRFEATLAKQHEESLAREKRMLASFQVAANGFQAALATRDEETLAMATEELGAGLQTLDARIAASVPPTVNFNATTSKAAVRAGAPWPPAEQRASAEEAAQCIPLANFLKKTLEKDAVSQYLGMFGMVVFAKACIAHPFERKLKYVVQNARVQVIYDKEKEGLLEQALEECKPHFDDVSNGKGGWTACAAVNAFLATRSWRNEKALSIYMNCLPTVAVVCAKQERAMKKEEKVYVLTELELECAHLKYWPMLCAYERRCGASRDEPDAPQNV